MLVNSVGYVIKTTKYSETSVIAKIYTELHGMLSFHIPGVYSKSSAIKPSNLQPLQKINLTYYYKENKNLKKIKELKIDKVYGNSYMDIVRSSIMLVICELLYKTVQEEEPNTELFGFINKATNELNIASDVSNYLVVFIIHLSKYLGFFPSGKAGNHQPYFSLTEGVFKSNYSDQHTSIQPPQSHVFGLIIDSSIGQQSELKISSNDRKILLDKLVLYYKIHVSDFKNLNSLQVLREVFKE